MWRCLVEEHVNTKSMLESIRCAVLFCDVTDLGNEEKEQSH